MLRPCSHARSHARSHPRSRQRSGHSRPRAATAPVAVVAAVMVVLGSVAPWGPPPAVAQAGAVFTGTMDGPTAGSDSPATGTIELVLDAQQTTVSYEITYRNLQGEEFEAHFHIGPPGSFGPPIHHLPLGTPKTGTWQPTDRQITALLDGEISVMVHTDLYPEGELGGWTEAESAPVDRATWESVKDLFR